MKKFYTKVALGWGCVEFLELNENKRPIFQWTYPFMAYNGTNG